MPNGNLRHADFLDWLDLKLPQAANEARRARNIYYGGWGNDLLVERAKRGEDWSFFCPNEARGLSDVWGDAFRTLYERHEREGKARGTMPARDLLRLICERQIETGGPYLMWKDACNRKSNHQHLGTIRGSNLVRDGVLMHHHLMALFFCAMAVHRNRRVFLKRPDGRLQLGFDCSATLCDANSWGAAQERGGTGHVEPGCPGW